MIFGRLRKFSAPKCILGLKEVPYLRYDITREGIKYGQKKVKGIINIGKLTTTTEAQELTGMVQYYRYMWPWW